jgi:nitroreductase
MSILSFTAETIERRFSCRTFSGEQIPKELRVQLADAAAAMHTGPFGSRLRFMLAAATAEDSAALKRLGTYGTIRGATAFILGAGQPGDESAGYLGAMYLEDFGYAMEMLILRATEMGLGTCWLGGFFSRGAFSRRMRLGRNERIPSVAAVGMILDTEHARDGFMRRSVGGSTRKSWDVFFHDGAFGAALTPEAAGPYAKALEMARLAPSASNRQPMRIVRNGAAWHFYIRRTPGYLPRFARTLTGIEDLQRVDCGIAMCHFEASARELGLAGRWVVDPPAIPLPDAHTEYAATWVG